MNIVGHRGASAAEAENTPAAFATADRMGADGVELDVRLAPDGRGGSRLVVYHNPLPTDQTEVEALPSFDEVLRACGDRMLVNVEIKNAANEGGFDPTMASVAPTIAAMRAFDPQPERWLISCFTMATIDHCRLVGPEFATAFLTNEFDSSIIEATAAGGHAAIHPWDPSVTPELVDEAHAAGLAVNTWTCNDPDRMVALRDMGVDGICTDTPDVARTALGRDGEVPVSRPTWARGGTRA